MKWGEVKPGDVIYGTEDVLMLVVGVENRRRDPLTQFSLLDLYDGHVYGAYKHCADRVGVGYHVIPRSANAVQRA